jgi:hypothetical protein
MVTWWGGEASPDLPAAGVSIEVKRTGHRLRSSSIVPALFRASFLLFSSSWTQNNAKKTKHWITIQDLSVENREEHVLLMILIEQNFLMHIFRA